MLWWFAQTSLIAGALAVFATLAGRWKRLGPEARHSLWLLVLIKLAIPPFIAWPWSVPDAWPARVEPVAAPVPVSAPIPIPVARLASPVDPISDSPPDAPTDPPAVVGPPPSPEEVLAGVEVAEEVPAALDPRPIESPPEISDPASAPEAQGSEISNLRFSNWNWDAILLAAWLAGSVVVVARRGSKVFRFHRSLADSRPAPGWLVDEARAIGDRVGVRPPPVVANPRVATPLLWCLGRPRLILPEGLIKRLGADRWPGILAHELAHLARGDHWVVRLELLVEAAWWWNPLFWLARRKLHEQAEIACDARVVRALPGRRYAYAEALVDVCEHIARSAIPSPSLGVGGAGAAHSLEGRLHMILRDPIPGRPTRRAALLAALLAALALPAWTLGQQQPDAPPAKADAPPSKPEAPAPAAEPAKAQAPDVPPSKLAAPAPEGPPQPSATTVEPDSIQGIRAAQAKAREGLGNLSFRYVVASRNQSRSPVMVQPAGGGRGGRGGMAGAMGGMPGMSMGAQPSSSMQMAGAMGGMPGMSMGAQPSSSMQRVEVVHVLVADVVLGPERQSRLDIIEAKRPSEPPSTPGRPLGWDRRFVASNGEGHLVLEMAWDKTGPVPFRWLGANSRQWGFGDSLTSTLFNNGQPPLDMDKGIDPLDPRPRNVLDLAMTDAALPFLEANNARAEVVGLETIDGREAVRVAWIANADIGLRGLLWLAPDLGYAVVRSDATQDPNQFGRGRRSWRRRSSDFAKVANLWLPRKVAYEEAEADPAGGEPSRRVEREMTFVDYRADPTLPADTFRPKLAIQALDDLTGNFTARPPGLPAGLVDLLEKAIAASKFGPPAVERTVEEPKAVATQPSPSGKPGRQKAGQPAGQPGGQPGKPGGEQPGKPGPGPGASQPPRASSKPGDPAPSRATAAALKEYADIVANVDEAPTGRPMIGMARSPFQLDAPAEDPAKADPKMIAKPAPGFDDPIPTFDPKVDDPISPKPLAGRAEIDPAIERRFKLDPEVIDLARQMTQASKKFEDVSRVNIHLDDPAVKLAQEKLNAVKSRYQQLWEEKSAKLRDELGRDLDRARDDIEVLQARRDGKAAELGKAEALLRGANLELTYTKTLADKKSISGKEVELYKAKVEVAEAEVAGKKAELAEADALLNQAKRRIGVATAAKLPPDPLADKAPSPIADGSKEAGRDAIALDARDEVALRQARRDGKAAEVQKAEAVLDRAGKDGARANTLMTRDAIGREDFDRIMADLKLAEADVASKKAELSEADVLSNHARRRLSARPAAPIGESTSGERPSTLPELRDAVELMEVQLQGKQAELDGAEAKIDSAKAILDVRKQLRADGRITQINMLESETDFRIAQAELLAKRAEVLESETRLMQARRRLDATGARVRREVARAKDRLDWSESQHKKGYVSKSTYEADKANYDELMIQLDPKYVPAPPVAAPPSPPGDQSRKEDAGPRLSVTLGAEEARISGQAIAYKVHVNNPGAEAAGDVKVVVSLPHEGGKLVALPPGAKFDQATRKLIWSIAKLEPLQQVEMEFAYGTSTPGRYQANAEASSGPLRARAFMITDVSALVDLDLQVTQTSRVMDVGKTNFYDITIKNPGTTEATRLQLGGKVTKNLKITKHFNVEKGEFKFAPETGQFVFPEIDRLKAGETITLTLEVQATEPGPAGCSVFASHAEKGARSDRIEDVISTTVTGEAPREPAAKPQAMQRGTMDLFSHLVGVFW